MKVMVTGGAGFVGSTLVPMLLHAGHEVKVYDSAMYGVDGLLQCWGYERFEFVKGDIRDDNAVRRAVENCDAVIHLAALVGYPICKKNVDEAWSVNSEGSAAVAYASVGLPFLLASTGSVYGSVGGVCTEDIPTNPITFYGRTKLAAEEGVRERIPNAIIYRFATGYGTSPRMRLDLLINDFCYKAVKERNLIVYEKDYKRTFIHVADMARAFIHGLKHYDEMKGEVYNVGSEAMNLTKEEIAEYILKLQPYYLHYAHVGHDEDMRNYEVSYEKIRRHNFSTVIPMEHGIKTLLSLFSAMDIRHPYSNI